MLHEFLSEHRPELIDRCRAKVAQRLSPAPNDAQIEHGIPHFLDQLIRTLRVEQTKDAAGSLRISGPRNGQPAVSEIGISAALHGNDLLRYGYTVDQVVHDYGDLCQAITDSAHDAGAKIEVDEFRTLNRCLDNAIADAVTEFSSARDASNAVKGARLLNERLGFLAHEMRNLLHTATLALAAIRTGRIGMGGATGDALDRSLIGLRTLVDRSLADVRLSAGLPARRGLISLAGFIADLKVSASLEAKERECEFAVSAVDPTLVIDADRDLLLGAVGNLLQNAFKFTGDHTLVRLDAYESGDRILIDVADRCGGLPHGDVETIFAPFKQTGADKSGLGLGLSICRRSVEVQDGTLSVRDVPGLGCVFTVSLPRHSMAAPVAA